MELEVSTNKKSLKGLGGEPPLNLKVVIKFGADADKQNLGELETHCNNLRL